MSNYHLFITLRQRRGFLLLLFLFALVVGFINPIRKMMTADDGWAYALTVRHLLETGKYQLHDWAAANMPVQIYWAALMAKLFGYSFSILRVSTLILLFAGLVAFYQLSRDFGNDDIEAGLLSITLLASPLVLFLSFTFQTDVQFLGWQILALWLYTRAFRRGNYLLMTLGSVAASAAIGTRQFGVGLIVGLAAVWLLLEKGRVRKVPFYLIGLVLPSIVAVWQISLGVSHPTFTQKVRQTEQFAYVHEVPAFLGNVLWRLSAIFAYLGFFLLPLIPVMLASIRSRRMGHEGSRESCERGMSLRWPILSACALYIVAGIGYGYWQRHEILMPFIDWLLKEGAMLESFLPTGLPARFALSILVYALAIFLAWKLCREYLTRQHWRESSHEEGLLVFCGVAAVGVQLLYVQFYDVYLIQFLPFFIFAVGVKLRQWPRWCRVSTALICMGMLAASTLWTRGNLEHADARWQAAELARSQGAEPNDVGGNMTWNCYNRAFDEWVESVGGMDAINEYSGANRIHAVFFNFLQNRYAQAKYAVSSSASAAHDPQWRVVRQLGYRNKWLRHRAVYLLQRVQPAEMGSN